jgi:hypothetical protein
MSSIAVFLILGGATAFAAKKITSKQLASNSVTTAKIKKNAVTASKIKSNSITTAKIAKDAVTGDKVNESTLGKVPSAANADNATNAVNAQNAAKVSGQSATKVFRILLPGESNVVVANISGFVITASCESGNVDVDVASPSSPSNVLTASGTGNPDGNLFEYDSEENGDAAEVSLDRDTGIDNTYGEATFSGATSAGLVVSGDLGFDYDTFGGESPERCVVYGQVMAG